jgi:beta-glucosidase
MLEHLDISVVDRAVLRVLTQKAELGLLDAGWTPPLPSTVDFDSPERRAVAQEIAEQSVVLLSNPQGVLPLRGVASIAVIGPVADEAASLFGCYSFPNHVLPGFPETEMGVVAPTILEAIREEFAAARVTYLPGVGITDPDTSGIEAAVKAASEAEVTILAVGDRSGMFGHGTSGEGCDVLDLHLPGIQEDLVKAVLGASRSVILVVMSGRPYAIGSFADQAAAAIQVFLPGQEGAGAIAAVLSGRVNPSGRLPVQIPGKASAQPGTYLAPALALRSEGVSNIDPTPAFPFGFGLGFSTFSITQVAASAAEISTDGEVKVTAIVQNTSVVAGTAVPQLYLSDPEADVTRPVRQLIGFQRVSLLPGQRAEVEFTVNADLASYTDRKLRRRVDSGRLVLTIATDAAEVGHALDVRLVGETRFVDATRTTTAVARVRALESLAISES